MKAHIQLYSDAIAAQTDEDSFQSWFNRAYDAGHARSNGFWDFAIHIATPAVRFHLGEPHECIALEIGCGGGRMLAAASYFFGQVIGLDIHSSLDRVAGALDARGIDNAELVLGDGETIPLADGSLDFVYSFIVLQHLPTFEVFRSYVRETFRCLKPGGLALLYYGKGAAVQELTGRAANHISLSMSREDAVRTATEAGFELLEENDSWRFGEPTLRRGYQGSVLLRRGKV